MVGGASSDAHTNVVLGGYSGSVAGLALQPDNTGALTLSLKFAYSSHASAVRALSLSGPTLVSGGTDEVIRIYDLSKKIEIGNLLHHDGTINALEFAVDAGRQILFSASDDASVCVWRCSDWTCLKRLSGHQSPILDLSVHPSARVALTVAKDRSLFMWNMVRGKICFSAKTKGLPATSVHWSPNGKEYILTSGSVVTLSSVEGRSVTCFEHEKPVLCEAFLDDNKLATGGEEKTVRVWDARENTKGAVIFKHEGRVRDLSFVDNLLVSADSGGGIKIWDVRMAGLPRLETSIGGSDMRVTCMTAGSAVRKVLEAVEAEEKEAAVEEIGWRAKANQKRRERQGVAKKISKPLEGTASQRKRKKKKNVV